MAYVSKHTVKAIGFPFPTRKVIHGQTIPCGAVCVQVTYAEENTPSPIVLGDRLENGQLKKDMFFALPVKDLFYYFYSTSSKKVILTPFTL